MNKKTNKEIVKLYYDELWNNQNKKYIDKLLDDDIFFHASLGVRTNGKAEFANYMDMILGAIPNLFHGVELMVCEDDNVAARAVYNGTHSGQLFEFEPTNKRIQYNGATFFKIRDGKITSIWVLGDLNSLYKQLAK